jgi:hypothetical protein
MVGGRGRHGQCPNEEVPYHKCSMQNVMIEDTSCGINIVSSGAKLGENHDWMIVTWIPALRTHIAILI